MKNLKITAYMSSPLVINHDLMLDAILIGKKAIELKLSNETLDPMNPLEIRDIVEYFEDIPLCSKAIFEGLDSKSVYYKRFDDDSEMYKITKKIETGKGKYKNYSNSLKVTDTDKVIFFAKGNKELIEKYLSWTCGLGKKLSQGYGLVRDWKVEEVAKEIDFFDTEQPYRPLPCELFKGEGTKKMVAYKFPYWFNGNKKVCYV